MIILVISMHAADTYSPFGNWYFVDRRPLSPATIVVFGAWQMYLQAFFMGGVLRLTLSCKFHLLQLRRTGGLVRRPRKVPEIFPGAFEAKHSLESKLVLNIVCNVLLGCSTIHRAPNETKKDTFIDRRDHSIAERSGVHMASCRLLPRSIEVITTA